jgi:hypothetical protein
MHDNLYKVAIPTTFIEDAHDGMHDQSQDNEDMCTLLSKIDSAPVKPRGNGFSVTVHLNENEFSALKGEADYKNEYWNTDAFGIKEARATIPEYAKSARRLAKRLGKIRESA